MNLTDLKYTKVVNPYFSTHEVLYTFQFYEAFRPKTLQITVIDPKTKQLKFVEICSICVMGCPQLYNYDGNYNPNHRGTSKFYEIEKPIDFHIFGACVGQGLQIIINNIYYSELKMSILLKGIMAPSSLIGSTLS